MQVQEACAVVANDHLLFGGGVFACDRLRATLVDNRKSQLVGVSQVGEDNVSYEERSTSHHREVAAVAWDHAVQYHC